MPDEHLTQFAFAELQLPKSVASGLEAAGFQYCTPIQAAALPLALQGQDVAGQAQTGTGKTAAFLIAGFSHLLRTPAPAQADQPRALVLAPTRELAVQIHRDAALLNQHTKFRLGLAYGGAGYDQQREQIAAGIDILIGTPGRLIDYFKQRVFNLKAIQVAVLDEADRMFDLGFISDVRYLFRRMPSPEARLSMLFSATLSLRVSELAYEHMNNPLSVQAEADTINTDKVAQTVYHPSNEEKIPLLLGLLKTLAPSRSMIFVNTKRAAELLQSYLEANRIGSAVLSGDIRQKRRLRVLREFGCGDLPVLIATDVAARGLHIPEVSHVFNYDLPHQAEDYVHRIGRTARAGATGAAISFACEDTAFTLPEIEAYIGESITTQSISDDLLFTPEPPSKTHSKHNQRNPSEKARPRRSRRPRNRRRGDHPPSINA